MGSIRRTLIATMLPIALLAAAGRADEPPVAAAKLEDVSVATEGDSTVVRLKTSSPRRYRADLIDAPYRLVLDLEDTTYTWRKTPLVLADGPVGGIRGSQYRKGVARVVLDLRSRVPYRIYNEGNSLVVVLGAPRAIDARTRPARAAAAVITPPPLTARRARESSPPPIGMAQAVPPPSVAPMAPAAPPDAPPISPALVPPTPAASDERLISLEFKDADVVNLLRILAAESGRNIVMGDDVKGKMSISLRNVPWTLALEAILEARGLQRVDRDGVMRIVSTEQLTKEREARARVEEAKIKAEVDIRTKKAEAELKEHETRAKMEEAKAKADVDIRTKKAEAELKEREAQLKEREAQLKEQDVERRKRDLEAALAEAVARGPLTETAIRLSYADAGDVTNTLQGLLGLGTQNIASCREEVAGKERETRTVRLRGGGGVSGPIAEPPFSQLFGPPRPEVPSLLPPEDVSARKVNIRAHCATNTLFLRLYAADLERVRRLVRDSLDIASPQVKIEARMEILDRDDLFVIGVQWGGGGVLAVDNRNAIVGRGFTSDPLNNPVGGGIPAAGLGGLSNPNLQVGTPGQGTVIPVSAQNGLPLGGNLINLPIGALLNNAAGLGGAGGIAFGIIGSRLNINLTLEALRTQGKTFTLARPDIITLENKEARISLGEEIPFATVSSAGTQIQFKEALLQLIVTPTVIRDPVRNKIKMIVMVENNARGTTVNLGSSGAPPAIQRRRAETEVVIGDGDHLVIGGITTSLQQEQIRKVPLFGDIPGLGWLFKQRGTQEARRELVVFITPSVLRTESRPPIPPPATRPPPPQPPAR